HCHGSAFKYVRGSKRADNFQQVIGVSRGVSSSTENHVVGSAFLLGAQPRCCEMRQWIEPVERADEPCEREDQAVATGNVRQLVYEDDAPPVRRPSIRLCWEENRRPPQTAYERHGRGVGH